MPLLLPGATQLVDGRPTHQILAIEERFDSVTIAVAPRRFRALGLLSALALVALATALWLGALAAVFGEGTGSLGYRLSVVTAMSVGLLGVLAFVITRLRKQVNHRAITVADGIVTLTGGPIWPTQKTLQLAAGDRMRAAYRASGTQWWPLRDGQREPIREYGVCVSGTRGKGERDVEIIPPFHALATRSGQAGVADAEVRLAGDRGVADRQPHLAMRAGAGSPLESARPSLVMAARATIGPFFSHQSGADV